MASPQQMLCPEIAKQSREVALRLTLTAKSIYDSGSQSGARGPPGVLEGVPGGPHAAK